MKKLILIFCLSLPIYCLAQKANTNPGFGQGSTQEICGQLSFSSDEEVITLVDQILDYAGVANRSYEVKGCANASGCFATVINEQQYIVYQPDYLKGVKKYGFTSASLPTDTKDWQALTILAHEVGHLINTHFYNNRQDLTAWNKELQADEFAGRILFQMNGTLEQAQSVYHTSIVPENGTMSHPPRQQRLDAIAKGYNAMAKRFAKIQQPVTTPETTTPATTLPKANNNTGVISSITDVQRKGYGENIPAYTIKKIIDRATKNADTIYVVQLWPFGSFGEAKMIAGMNTLIDKYKSKPVKFILVSRNPPADYPTKIQKSIDKYGYMHEVGWIGTGFDITESEVGIDPSTNIHKGRYGALILHKKVGYADYVSKPTIDEEKIIELVDKQLAGK